jgi:hypothetical protein
MVLEALPELTGTGTVIKVLNIADMKNLKDKKAGICFILR